MKEPSSKYVFNIIDNEPQLINVHVADCENVEFFIDNLVVWSSGAFKCSNDEYHPLKIFTNESGDNIPLFRNLCHGQMMGLCVYSNEGIPKLGCELVSATQYDRHQTIFVRNDGFEMVATYENGKLIIG